MTGNGPVVLSPPSARGLTLSDRVGVFTADRARRSPPRERMNSAAASASCGTSRSGRCADDADATQSTSSHAWGVRGPPSIQNGARSRPGSTRRPPRSMRFGPRGDCVPIRGAVYSVIRLRRGLYCSWRSAASRRNRPRDKDDAGDFHRSDVGDECGACCRHIRPGARLGERRRSCDSEPPAPRCMSCM